MKKKLKKGLAIILCLTMIFNYFFSVLADENVESSEPETTYIEDTESTGGNDTIDNIEEIESDEEEIEEEVLDEVSEEIDESQEGVEELEKNANIEEKPQEGKQEGENNANKELSEKIENATLSEIVESVEEEKIDDATPSEIEEIIDEKCEVTIYFLTDMKLKDKGNGGSYNYSWDTFIVDKNKEFNIDEKIPEVIKHSSCEQEYTLVGFTTENQMDSIWKGADYAGGVSTLDKRFIVNNDMEIFAVYEAKDIYISSIIIDSEISYNTTTIPNKAIKNIIVSDNKNNIYIKNENVKYYKIKNNLDNTNYMFTKDSSEGKPIKVEEFSLDKYK